jgi:nitroreductase
MSEFADVVRRRRMTRSFRPDPVDGELIARLVDLGSRAPSAGKSQGWHLIVLQGVETTAFWDITLPPVRRRSFRWKRLLDAPVIALPLADPQAYIERYAEPDKAATRLGTGRDQWPVPYWTIDASMSVMTMLLAAEDVGLGALFFGVFRGERELRQALRIPPGMELLGAIALGWPAGPDDTPGAMAKTAGTTGEVRRAFAPGHSSSRPRRRPDEIIHRRVWRG